MTLLDQVNRISIFAGSKFSSPRNPNAEKEVENLAQEVLNRDLKPFYGGGFKGYMGKFAEKITSAGKEIFAVRKTDPKKTNVVFVSAKNDVEKKLIFKEAAHAVLAPGGSGSIEEFWDYLDNKVIKGNGKIGILNIDGFYNVLVNQLSNRIDQDLINSKVFIESTAAALMQKLLGSK